MEHNHNQTLSSFHTERWERSEVRSHASLSMKKWRYLLVNMLLFLGFVFNLATPKTLVLNLEKWKHHHAQAPELYDAKTAFAPNDHPEQDCDQEGCSDHRCHWGHCAYSLPADCPAHMSQMMLVHQKLFFESRHHAYDLIQRLLDPPRFFVTI